MNTPPLFPPELRTASVVPRWSIVWTLCRDTVTNHSYYVTFYAHQIARMLAWEGPMAALMFRAITHDLDETITGDIVSPVKDEILDNARASDYIDLQMNARLPTVLQNIDMYEAAMTDDEIHEVELILKVADRLDALIFLIMEQRLGNGVIAPRIPSAMARLESAFRELPVDKTEIDRLWNTVMLPAVHHHQMVGGFGI